MDTEYKTSNRRARIPYEGETYPPHHYEVVAMDDEVFTDPEETADEWVDVRMTNPEEGEWDVDMVVVDGRVSYVDQRIRPEFLSGFIKCLIDDISSGRGSSLLTEMAERNNIDLLSTIENE